MKEFDLLAKALQCLNKETDTNATQKMLLCVAALIRGDPEMHEPFLAMNGYASVAGLSKHKAIKVRRKAVFFLLTILQQVVP